MKKFFAILLALVLTLSLGVTAFAAEDDAPSVQPEAVEVTKEYTLNGGAAAPVEELSFTVVADGSNQAGVNGDVVVGTENKVTTSGQAKTKFNITFPTYTKVGVYKYTITEVAPDPKTAGVTYDTVPITVVVTITNAVNSQEGATGGTSDQLAATVAIHKTATPTKDNKLGKDDSAFTNTYGQGELTVTKQVTGNLASNTKKFTIHVTFTATTKVGSEISYTVADGPEQKLAFNGTTATTDIELSSTQSATFSNIPDGVTYTVVEDAKHAEGKENPETTEEGYTATYANKDNTDTTTGSGAIAANDKDTVTITNEKKTEVDTGISLDSLPYILIVAVILAASVVMVVSKRRSEV